MRTAALPPRGRAVDPPPISKFDTRNNADYAPAEPGLMDRADELNRHLENVDANLAVIRGRLFGDGEVGGPAACIAESLEGKIARACETAAAFVGRTATIIDRLENG